MYVYIAGGGTLSCISMFLYELYEQFYDNFTDVLSKIHSLRKCLDLQIDTLFSHILMPQLHSVFEPGTKYIDKGPQRQAIKLKSCSSL